MSYLLDTNVCIRYLNGRVPQVRARLLTLDKADIAVSIITKAELYYGSAKSQTPTYSRANDTDMFLDGFTLLPFDYMAVEQYAVLRKRRKQSRCAGLTDCRVC